jgi:hypothetical protein
MNHVHTYDTGVRWQMMGPPYLWIEIWCQCGASRMFGISSERAMTTPNAPVYAPAPLAYNPKNREVFLGRELLDMQEGADGLTLEFEGGARMVFPREAEPANRKALQERVNLLEIYGYMIEDFASQLARPGASKEEISTASYARAYQKFLVREPGADTSGLAKP